MTIQFPADNVLGYTYDAFSLYADPSAAIKRVVLFAGEDEMKLNDVTYTLPSGVSLTTNDKSVVYMASGADFNSYSASLDAKVSFRGRKRGMFAKTKVTFDASVRGRQTAMFAMLFDQTEAAIARIDDLSSMQLDATFVAQLNDGKVAPQTLFRTYGTHIVSGVIVGGCVRYTAWADATASYTKAKFEADVRARYKLYSGSVNVSADGSAKNAAVHDVGNLEVVGGSQAARSGLTKSQDFTGWVDSVASNPEFIDFIENGLTPIWELCSQPTRRQELESAFATLYTATRGASTWVDMATKDKPEHSVSTSSSTSFVTGVAGHIVKDDFVGFAVQFEDAATGDRVWQYATSDRDFNHEIPLTSVPPGCALTGLAARAANGDWTNAKLYYQCLNLGSA